MQDKTDFQLLSLAKEFGDHHSHFNMDFIDSLEESFIQHDRLSIKQRKALENIIHSWKMNDWAEENI